MHPSWADWSGIIPGAACKKPAACHMSALQCRPLVNVLLGTTPRGWQATASQPATFRSSCISRSCSSHRTTPRQFLPLLMGSNFTCQPLIRSLSMHVSSTIQNLLNPRRRIEFTSPSENSLDGESHQLNMNCPRRQPFFQHSFNQSTLPVKGFDMEMQLVHNAVSHQVRLTALQQLHAVMRAPFRNEAADGQLLVTSVFLKVRPSVA